MKDIAFRSFHISNLFILFPSHQFNYTHINIIIIDTMGNTLALPYDSNKNWHPNQHLTYDVDCFLFLSTVFNYLSIHERLEDRLVCRAMSILATCSPIKHLQQTHVLDMIFTEAVHAAYSVYQTFPRLEKLTLWVPEEKSHIEICFRSARTIRKGCRDFQVPKLEIMLIAPVLPPKEEEVDDDETDEDDWVDDGEIGETDEEDDIDDYDLYLMTPPSKKQKKDE